MNGMNKVSKINEVSSWRIDNRVSIINQLLQKTIIKKIDTYLDLGCGDGTITTAVGTELNTRTTYCADIIEIKENYDNLTYLQIDEKENKLNISDKSIDLITCLVSIHHFQNLANMISEMNRVSKIGTYLIIREHDATLTLQPYLDFIHFIYLIEKGLNFEDYYGAYYTKEELRKSFENHGWKHLYTIDNDSSDLTTELKIANPQKIYHSIFEFIGIKEKWINPIAQTSEFRLNNNKLLKYISGLYNKQIYVKVLKKHGIKKKDAEFLLKITDNKLFAEQYLKIDKK
jgi:ubiquinone/menaquinone biosynthesis C-methylase UbiE